MSFLALPAEIRIRIYEEAFGNHDVHIEHNWVERESTWKWGHHVCMRPELSTHGFSHGRKCCTEITTAANYGGIDGRLAGLASGLLFSCRQTYLEGIEILHTTNKFKLTLDSLPTDFLPSNHLSDVREVDIFWELSYTVSWNPIKPAEMYRQLWSSISRLEKLRKLRVVLESGPTLDKRGLSSVDGPSEDTINEWMDPVNEGTGTLNLLLFELLLPFEVPRQMRDAFGETDVRRISSWQPTYPDVMFNAYPDSEDDVSSSFE